jgi:hypothetical protein
MASRSAAGASAQPVAKGFLLRCMSRQLALNWLNQPLRPKGRYW